MSKTGEKTDGCAIFYRPSKFTLDAQQFVEYWKPGCKVLKQDNIALLARFKTVVPPSSRKAPELLCVACTHLLFNHNRGEIKLAQVRYNGATRNQAADTNVN